MKFKVSETKHHFWDSTVRNHQSLKKNLMVAKDALGGGPGVWVKMWTSEPCTSHFEFQPHHLIALQTGSSHLTFFSFFIC